MLSSNAALTRRLDDPQKKYNAQFKTVFDAIRALMAPPEKAVRSIGFRVEEARPGYGLARRRRATGTQRVAEREGRRLPDGFAGFRASSAVAIGCPYRPVGASGEWRDRRAGETHKIMTVPHSREPQSPRAAEPQSRRSTEPQKTGGSGPRSVGRRQRSGGNWKSKIENGDAGGQRRGGCGNAD